MDKSVQSPVMGLSKHQHSVQNVVDQMVRDILRMQGGYSFITNLPKEGRGCKQSLLRKWRERIEQLALPQELLVALTKASLKEDGSVDGRGLSLVTWLIEHVFGTPEKLFQFWLSHCKPVNVDKAKG